MPWRSYEWLFAHCVELNFRYLNQFGDPVIVPAPPECLQPIGFEEDDALFSNDKRIFRGFDFLREYFLFPQKFLAFELTKLAKVMPRLPANAVEVIFRIQRGAPRGSLRWSNRRCYRSTPLPAINLFEKTTDRISIKPEPARIPCGAGPQPLSGFRAAPAARGLRAPVRRFGKGAGLSALFIAAGRDWRQGASLLHATASAARRRGQQERRYGSASDYTGTRDMFIALSEPASGRDGSGNICRAQSVRALCSNRHLPEQLPVGEGGADFRLIDNIKLDVMCIDRSDATQGPVVGQIRSRREMIHSGAAAWRLINLLSLSHLGLVERGGGRGGKSLIEILSHFADLSDSATEAKIQRCAASTADRWSAASGRRAASGWREA